MKRFEGVYPIAVTPFDSSGAVDLPSFVRVIQHCLAADVDGFAYPANASEAFTLTDDERRDLVKALLDTVGGQVPVIVGVSTDDAERSRALALHACANQASGILFMPPPAQPREMLNFCQEVCRDIAVPVFIQNAPPPMGPGVDLPLLTEIVAAVPQIQYIKEEGIPSGQRISTLTAALGSKITGIFGGDGGRAIVNELQRGALGTMPAVEIIELQVKTWEAFRSGDLETAYKWFEMMLPILNMQRIFKWALTKEILVWRNLINTAFVRAPAAIALDDVDKKELRALFARVERQLKND